MPEEIQAAQKYVDLAIDFLIRYGFQILAAVIILVIGIALARWVGRLVTNVCEKRNLDVTLSRFLGGATKTVVLVFVVIVAIGKFGISIAPFIAALGAVAFGGTFALQGPLSNYGAGLTIILTRPFVVGNTLAVKGVSGVVEEIGLAATRLTTEDGEEITIPNKHIIGEILVNSFANRVVESRVGIAYTDDPETAVRTIRECLAKIPEVVFEPEPQVGIEEFGDSAVNIGFRYWVPTKEYFQTSYKANLAIHKALKRAGITIPFPQRDVHVVGDLPANPGPSRS